MEHLKITETRSPEQPKRTVIRDVILEASLSAMKTMSHPRIETEPDTPKPKEIFTAIGRSLCNITQNIDLTRKLLDDQPEQGWTEEMLKELPGWKTETGNTVLPILANLCRIGAIKYENGCWINTDFCEQIRPMLSSDWTETSAQVQAALKFSSEFHDGISAGFDSAFNTLQKPHIHHIVTELLPREININLDGLLKLCAEDGGDEHCHHAAQTAIASLAALGAIEHYGHYWQLTLYGQWLVNNHSSEINKKLAA